MLRTLTYKRTGFALCLLLTTAISACNGHSNSSVSAAISSFTATPITIAEGASSTLTPVFTNGAGVISPGNIAATSGTSVTVTPATTTTYTLTVTPASGTPVSQAVTISVLAPTIASFTASPAAIPEGASTSLTPIFANGTGVIAPGNIPATSGTAVTATPAATTTYTLSVTPASGTAITQSVTVTVLPPTIASFTASPAAIPEGASTTLTPVFANGAGVIAPGNIPVTSGTAATVTPASTTTYTLSVTPVSGTAVTQSVTVTVLPPTITSFTASPGTITPGAIVTLSGVFANGAGLITPGNFPATSGSSVTVSPTATTTYTLAVTPAAGAPVTQSVTVNVNSPTLPPLAPPFGWVGVIGAGQSLSVGCYTAAISTSQPFKNMKLLDSGPVPQYPVYPLPTAIWSAIPLVEPIRTYVPGYGSPNTTYPNNICVAPDGSYGETPHSGFANTMSSLWAYRGWGDYITAHTVSGVSGACIDQIDREAEDTTYDSGISEAIVYANLAKQAGVTYGVGGILLTHGECDSLSPVNPNYEQQLYHLWTEYTSDLKNAIGQTHPVIMFGSQQSSIYAGLNGPNVQLWRAGVDYPGKIVCTGPKYQYGPNYGIHMFAADYERLGEKYAEVFDAVVNLGVNWKPLGPNLVTRNGAVVTINFDVPTPPLVWDTNLTPPHQQLNTAWANGNGFEVTDQSGNEIQIQSVAIQGNSVILTLFAVPAPDTNLTLAYALTQDDIPSAWDAGYPNGMHGLLRDSDNFVGYAVETIDVYATNGSNILTGDPNVFARRAGYDIVTGPNIADGTIVTSVSGAQINLSTPWTGASGPVQLTFRHNQYNYCVHFSMPIP